MATRVDGFVSSVFIGRTNQPTDRPTNRKETTTMTTTTTTTTTTTKKQKRPNGRRRFLFGRGPWNRFYRVFFFAGFTEFFFVILVYFGTGAGRRVEPAGWEVDNHSNSAERKKIHWVADLPPPPAIKMKWPEFQPTEQKGTTPKKKKEKKLHVNQTERKRERDGMK